MAEVKAPVKGFSGQVVGVDFSDGVGTCDDDNTLAYFRRHGYEVTEAKPKRSSKS